MDQSNSRTRPYALKAGEEWTYRFGIDFTVKAGEVREGSGMGLTGNYRNKSIRKGGTGH